MQANNLRLVQPPRIRRLACTMYFDELECSQDHSRVRVDAAGNAHCAYGHTWTDQADQYGNRPTRSEGTNG